MKCPIFSSGSPRVAGRDPQAAPHAHEARALGLNLVDTADLPWLQEFDGE
jgi:hypothetical protein